MNPVVNVERVGKSFRRYHDGPSGKPSRRPWRSDSGGWALWSGSGALREVSFTVAAGETVGIIGANGSGKSTLLRLIGDVGRPDTGRITVHGRIGALLDLGAGFHPDLTGRENAILARILNGLTRRQVLERLDAIFAFAEVERVIDAPMRAFSSGMRMRLAFAVAVHTDPDLLLIDEVLVGDVAFQRKCMDRIAEYRAAGCSILYVSHDEGSVQDLCDRVIWLRTGVWRHKGALMRSSISISGTWGRKSSRPPTERSHTPWRRYGNRPNRCLRRAGSRPSTNRVSGQTR